MSRVLAQITTSAYTPAAPAGTTVGTTSATILAAPTSPATRTMLRIQNTHASNILYIREDGGAVTTSANGHHLKLGPGEGWDWESRIPQGAITAIASAAGTTVAITYAEV